MKEIDAIRRIHNRTGRLIKLKELGGLHFLMEKERHLIRLAIDYWVESLLADRNPDA